MKISDYTLPPIPGFAPFFLFKKKQTHILYGAGGNGRGFGNPLTTIKLSERTVFGVAVCLSLCPDLHHVGSEC